MKSNIVVGLPLSATQRLTALQDRQRELTIELESARDQYRCTSMELTDTLNIVRGYEHSLNPVDQARSDEAKTRVDPLKEQLETERARIAAMEGELNTAKKHIAALFEGQDGHEVAVTIYREAAAHVAEAESALTAHQAKQQTAALALGKAEQARAAVTRDLENALDAKDINRVRAVLTEAQQAEGDARTLMENLQRHGEKLAAECESALAAVAQAKQRAFKLKAALLADALKQQLTGPETLKAFAAARLAGSGRSFLDWLGDMIDPRLQHLPPATDAQKAALVAELEGDTHA